ncbi:hypothetical protein D3C86_1509070 [compost metagenome]
MDGAARERKQENVHASPRGDAFDQQPAGRRQRTGFTLNAQQGFDRAHFRVVAGLRIQALHFARQLRGQWHAPALPRCHRPIAPLGPPHIGRHAFQAHQFQGASGKLETVARPQPRQEPFFDRTQPAAAQILHRHRAVRRDGADGQAMPQRDAAVMHAVAAVFVFFNAAEFRIVG